MIKCKMKLLNKFFPECAKKNEPDDILHIANTIGPIIDKTAIDVFLSNRNVLLSEPVTYVVPAVWGVKKGGTLDSVQMQMHRQISLALDTVIESLQLDDLNSSQKFAVGFLVRGYIISKIAYIIESFKNRLHIKKNERDEANEFMTRVKPLGSA